MSEEQKAAEGELEIDEKKDAYRVSLPAFDGPLDLLLHLIKKHELDILDIPIGFISKKYVEYIKTMELLSIDIASEYLVMAATLAHIKSRSLLPPDPSAAADDDLLAEEEDPRAELIRRLLEYQKYKNAAENLSGRAVLGRDVFTRGAPNDETIGPAPLAPLSLFKLVDAFEAVLQRVKQVEDHQIDFERISISERIGQISELLRERGGQLFEQLFDNDATRADMIVTFLAILEMTKLRMTKLVQEGPLEPIFVELSHTYDDDEDDVLESASPATTRDWRSEFDDDDDSDEPPLGEQLESSFSAEPGVEHDASAAEPAFEHAGAMESSGEDATDIVSPSAGEPARDPENGRPREFAGAFQTVATDYIEGSPGEPDAETGAAPDAIAGRAQHEGESQERVIEGGGAAPPGEPDGLDAIPLVQGKSPQTADDAAAGVDGSTRSESEGAASPFPASVDYELEPDVVDRPSKEEAGAVESQSISGENNGGARPPNSDDHRPIRSTSSALLDGSQTGDYDKAGPDDDR